MAQEISRTFDTARAAVIVTVQDEFGNQSFHTIHVLDVSTCPECGEFYVKDTFGNVDVAATVAQICAEIDAANAKIKQRLMAAGWQG